jgi:hypothetical protein
MSLLTLKRKHSGRSAKAVRPGDPSDEVDAVVASAVIVVTVVVCKAIDYLVCKD